MRLRYRWALVALTLFLASCATVARPPVLSPPPPSPSEIAPETRSYRTAADAPRVLEAIDQKLAARQATAADLPTADLEVYSNLLLTAGRLPEADQALQALNTRKPGDRNVLLRLALVAEARGSTDVTSRLAALEAASPGDPDAADLRARRALARGDKVGAKAAWTSALTQREDSGALLGLATLALGEKKPQVALSFADRAVQANPTDDQAWAVHAQVQSSLGAYRAAKRDLDQAVTLAPDDPWHRLDRGKLSWLRLYDSRSAQADLELVTMKDPDNFFGWSALAEVYEDLDRPRDAYNAWMKALSLRPDYRFGYPSAAMLSFRFQDFPRAAAYAREAAKDYPAEYAFPFIEALSLKALNRWPEAVPALEKARPRFTRGSTVDEFFRFLLTPSSGADYYFNTAMNLEKTETTRLRLRFYQGCFYAMSKSQGAAKAAFDEVGASTLMKIPEIAASRDWSNHGF